MKNGLSEIVGKQIAGVIVASGPNSPRQQLLLTFADGTWFEIWGESFTCAGGVDTAGSSDAAAYARKNGGQVSATYGNAAGV